MTTHRVTAPVTTPHPLPLYLTGGSTRRVERDGPALLVRRLGAASSRYPLARISRIISAAHVQWDPPALAACLEQGLPVVFLDGRGEVAGYLHPVHVRPSSADRLVYELLDRPDGLDRYTTWLRGERGRVMNAWRKRPGSALDETDYRELVRRYVYLGEDPLAAIPGAGLLRGALLAQVTGRLRQAGLQPRYWGLRGQPLNLALDVTSLLALELGLTTGGLAGRMRGDDSALLTLWHVAARGSDLRIADLTGRLHRFLEEVLGEWR